MSIRDNEILVYGVQFHESGCRQGAGYWDGIYGTECYEDIWLCEEMFSPIAKLYGVKGDKAEIIVYPEDDRPRGATKIVVLSKDEYEITLPREQPEIVEAMPDLAEILAEWQGIDWKNDIPKVPEHPLVAYFRVAPMPVLDRKGRLVGVAE